jgi:hypothetical protein
MLSCGSPCPAQPPSDVYSAPCRSARRAEAQAISCPRFLPLQVVVSLGKGVFSSVLRARDITRKDLDTNQHPEVAIKVGG